MDNGEGYSSSEEENVIHINVECPSHLNSYIIGVKGNNIKPVRQEFPEVSINIGTKPDYIQVKGPESKVREVKDKLQIMIKEGLQTYKSCNIDIGNDMKTYLLEKNAFQLDNLRQETRIAINILETPEQCTLRLDGNEDGVEKAKKAITTIMDQLDLLDLEVELNIERCYHGAIMGHQAVILNEIKSMFSGVQIKLPGRDDISDTIKIHGPKKMVIQCQLHLLQRVEIRKKLRHITKTHDDNKSAQYGNMNASDGDQPISENELPAEKWMNKYIIGKDGCNISKITKEFPLIRIHFKDDSSGGIVLEGPTADVDAATNKMNIEIANLSKIYEKETLTMDIKFKKHMIGKQGNNINRIREESGAIVSIDNVGEMCSITLQGTQESVNRAKEVIEGIKNFAEIAEFSEEFQERAVKIKKCCYDNICGTQGLNLNALRMRFNKVKMELTDKGHSDYIIQLRGLKEDINQCEDHFNSIVKECESSGIQGSISTTSINSEISYRSSQINLNAGNCLEHSANLLNLRCVTHKAWICVECCEEEHPRDYCRIITFEEELATRKVKEEQRLQEESKKVSDTIASLIEFGDKKETERNSNSQTLKEMQVAMEKIMGEIGQLVNEMAVINLSLSEGKEFQHKLDEKKDGVSSATTISELSSFTKTNSAFLTESKKWYEKCKNNY